MRDLLEAIRQLWRTKKRPPGVSFRRDQIAALASPRCVGPDRLPIMHMQRFEAPADSDLTGWLVDSGEEPEGMLRDPAVWVKVSLPGFIREDPTLAPIVDSPVGSEWIRNKAEMIWRRVVDDRVVDGYGHPIASFRKEEHEEEEG